MASSFKICYFGLDGVCSLAGFAVLLVLTVLVAAWYNAMQYNTVVAAWYNGIQYNIVVVAWYNTMVAAWYSTIQYSGGCLVQYNTLRGGSWGSSWGSKNSRGEECLNSPASPAGHGMNILGENWAVRDQKLCQSVEGNAGDVFGRKTGGDL